MLSNGHGIYRPRNRCKLSAEVECRLGGNDGECLIPKGIYDITLDEADSEIWDEVEACLMTMKDGEESEFYQGKSNRWYKIKLLSFENSTEFWKLTEEEKLVIAIHHKERGNELFKQVNIKSSASRYCRALKYLISIVSLHLTVDISAGIKASTKELKIQCLLNLSMCHLRLKSYQYAVETTTKVLTLDSNNSKALYRRGVANLELGNVDEAYLDLSRAKEYDPNSKAIRDQLIIIQHIKKTDESALQKAMKKMFSDNY